MVTLSPLFKRSLWLILLFSGLSHGTSAQDRCPPDSGIVMTANSSVLGPDPVPSDLVPFLDGGIQPRRLAPNAFYNPNLAAMDGGVGSITGYAVPEGKVRFDRIPVHGRTLVRKAGERIHIPTALTEAHSPVPPQTEVTVQVRENVTYAEFKGKHRAIPVELEGTLTPKRSSKSIPVTKNYSDLPASVQRLVERDMRVSFNYADELPTAMKLQFNDATYSLIMIGSHGERIAIRALPLMTVEVKGEVDPFMEYATTEARSAEHEPR
jgi:hypothetical protein